MLLGLEWFWETPTGITALLMVMMCLFAGIFQWARTRRKIDKSGYVRMPYGPFGLLSKDVPLTKAPKDVLEGIIADLKAAGQEPPKLLLDILAGTLPNGVQGDPAPVLTQTNAAPVLIHETKEALKPSPVGTVDPELAAMLGINAAAAGTVQLPEDEQASQLQTADASPQPAPSEKPIWPRVKKPKPTACKICGNPKVHKKAPYSGLCQYHYRLAHTRKNKTPQSRYKVKA